MVLGQKWHWEFINIKCRTTHPYDWHDDLNTLVKVPGVGKKTAERLMIELRDRFKALAQTTSSTTNTTATQIQFMANSPVAEAEAALQSLGYKLWKHKKRLLP